MAESVISEGKTTEEAISNGLKILQTTRDNVDIRIIEEPSKRFFSILAPRIVKVELTIKNDKKREEKKKEKNISNDVLEQTKNDAEEYLNQFFANLKQNVNIKVEIKENNVFVSVTGNNLGYLIGYRGETLDSLQTIMNASLNKGREEFVKVVLDIENYRQKREKTLVNLAKSIAMTVVRERKSITLEPMTPLERKIIHSTLQNNSKVETTSIGEEPYRKVVISLKK